MLERCIGGAWENNIWAISTNTTGIFVSTHTAAPTWIMYGSRLIELTV